MSNVQEVFDKVIKAGLYVVWSKDNAMSTLMCYAMGHAKAIEVISKEEYALAKSEIAEYLGAFGSLAGMLAFRELPYEFNDRLAIYKDWDNRPKFN